MSRHQISIRDGNYVMWLGRYRRDDGSHPDFRPSAWADDVWLYARFARRAFYADRPWWRPRTDWLLTRQQAIDRLNAAVIGPVHDDDSTT